VSAPERAEAPPARCPVVSFDHFTHVTLEGSDTAWRELRQEHPVAWTEANGGHWIISGYDEVADAFRDWETFSSARVDPAISSLSIGDARMPLLVPEELDPPEWHEYRTILARLLSPHAVKRLRPRVRHWVEHHVDAFIERGQADLAHELAVPVPSSVTMEWLGWPEDEWTKAAGTFHQMARHEYLSPGFIEAGRQFGWLAKRIHQEVALRREEPRDDALTVIATHEIDGRRISAEYAEAMVLLVIGGGVDTTTSLTSAALVHLGRDPELRARLRHDRSLIPMATEEFLRTYPPARTHARTVARETEFGGCTLRAGDRVLLSEVSACHDEAAFPDAQSFVADRSPNRHPAFGLGIHRCPGSHLARLEFAEILDVVLDRLPDYELQDVAEYPNWAAIGGWATITVAFPPGVVRSDA
jgi:cytochrome P450